MRPSQLAVVLGVALWPSGPVLAESPRPLPGNEPCLYPPAASQQNVGGAVRFVARVTSEGVTESVEIRAVPLPDLGFEEAVRSCVARWRFDSAGGGEDGLRAFESAVRYSVLPAEEEEVQRLLARLAEAWNAGDERALDELETRDGELPWLPSQSSRFLGGRIREAGADADCQMHLEGGLSRVRFLGRNLVEMTQRFSCRPSEGVASPVGPLESLDLMAAKGPRGWRFATISEADRPWYGAQRVGGRIPEPRKVKHVSPEYPQIAKSARVQGVVILECVISPEGNVSDMKVLRGIPLLDAAAIEAVRQWIYTPTLVGGRPVPVIMTVTVNFKLGPGPASR